MLAIAVVGLLILCSLWIVRPFLPATIWAITIVVATWPLLLRLQHLLWGSRSLAVVVTTLVVLVVFVAPFWLATSTIVTHADEIMRLINSASTYRIPPVPHWVHEIPLIGAGLSHTLTEIEDAGLADLAPRLAPYAGRATQIFIGLAGGFGLLVLQFLLTVIIAAIIHANGEAAGRLVLRLGHRIAGERGRQMVVLTGHAIRAVAVGVMVTTLAESLVGGIGLYLAGVPLASVLTAVMFVVCLAQLGPGVVLIPATLWLFVFRDAGHAVLLLGVLAIAVTIDTVLRPLLIKREADMPTLLVLVGVLGGLAAFGLVGIFVGPAVLAVSYTMLQAWLAEDIVPAPIRES